MIMRILSGIRRAGSVSGANGSERFRHLAVGTGFAVLLAGGVAWGQVITVNTSGKGPVVANGPVGREYQQIKPTNIKLSDRPLDPKTKLMLVRALQSEQGFAMRPFPRGHKGLKLQANGNLEPAGEAYLDMATQNGISANPGQRVVITNIKIDRNKIVLDLNGGPDAKHRFLRHIQIGMGDPTYGDPTQPIVPDSGQQPTGARITLEFKGHVPELTGDEVEALLAPMISFKVQTPVEAYTATLPAPLKKAILDHKVLVGMNTEMVTFAKGRPDNKYREDEGNMPVTTWMYGKPPHTVEFVKINGNRVIRVEIARIGQPLEVFDKDVVTPMLQGSGTKLEASNIHVVQEGDVERNPDTQAPAPPPSLRQPGDTIPNPNGTPQKDGAGPVYFPKQKPYPYPDDTSTLGRNPDTQPPPPAQNPPASQSGTKPASSTDSQQQDKTGSQQQKQPASQQQKQPASQQQTEPVSTQPQ